MCDVNKVLSHIIRVENNKDLKLKLKFQLSSVYYWLLPQQAGYLKFTNLILNMNMNITDDEIIFTLKDLTKSRRVGQSPISVKFPKYEEHQNKVSYLVQ